MDRLETAEISISPPKSRIIGSIEGDESGPTIIFLSGMHGNESAGVEAIIDVLKQLQRVQPYFHGEMFGIRSNIKALEQNVRYIDEDMNRIWFPSIIKKIKSTPESELDSNERIQVKRLLKVLEGIREQSNSTLILADLHTFSAEGYMFLITNPVVQQMELLSNLHAPMVFGIEETLRGTALSYYKDQDLISFVLEGGQHENKLTKYNITASIMLLLCAAGCIKPEQTPAIEEFHDHLKSHTRKLPPQAELVYQHIIEPGDKFSMRPGYQNFQPVKKGEWLANDKDGKITAQTDGFILMPLYQKQGNDGFFIIKGQDSS